MIATCRRDDSGHPRLCAYQPIYIDEPAANLERPCGVVVFVLDVNLGPDQAVERGIPAQRCGRQVWADLARGVENVCERRLLQLRHLDGQGKRFARDAGAAHAGTEEAA